MKKKIIVEFPDDFQFPDEFDHISCGKRECPFYIEVYCNHYCGITQAWYENNHFHSNPMPKCPFNSNAD